MHLTPCGLFVQALHVQQAQQPPTQPAPALTQRRPRGAVNRSASAIAPAASQRTPQQPLRRPSLPGEGKHVHYQALPTPGEAAWQRQHSRGPSQVGEGAAQSSAFRYAHSGSALSSGTPGTPPQQHVPSYMAAGMAGAAQQMAAAARNENSVIARFRHCVRLPGDAGTDTAALQSIFGARPSNSDDVRHAAAHDAPRVAPDLQQGDKKSA